VPASAVLRPYLHVLPRALLAAIAVASADEGAVQAGGSGPSSLAIGGALGADFEPSGAAWHPRLGALLVVDDGGGVAVLDASGGLRGRWSVPGAPDLEGVCVADPSTPFAYLAIEAPARILEFDLERGIVRRAFDLARVLPARADGGPPDGERTAGVEALTFVPDASHAEGGRFLVGHQGDGRVDVVELPVRSVHARPSAHLVESFTPWPGHAELSGLDYDAGLGLLFAVYDAAERLRATTLDGQLVEEWRLAADDPEGVAVTGCRVFVADDGAREVWRLDALLDRARCCAPRADVAGVSLSAGGLQRSRLDAECARAGSLYVLERAGDAPLALPGPRALAASSGGSPRLGVVPAREGPTVALRVPPASDVALAGRVLEHDLWLARPTAGGPRAERHRLRLALRP